MNLFKNFSKKIDSLSVSSAIIITGILISLSIFFTVYLFFGGMNNRNKLFFKNPTINRNVTQIDPLQNIKNIESPKN